MRHFCLMHQSLTYCLHLIIPRQVRDGILGVDFIKNQFAFLRLD